MNCLALHAGAAVAWFSPSDGWKAPLCKSTIAAAILAIEHEHAIKGTTNATAPKTCWVSELRCNATL